MNSPVLLIAYSRPDTTRMVFERIKQAQPEQLYFAVDVPRNPKGKVFLLIISVLKMLLMMLTGVVKYIQDSNELSFPLRHP